MRKKLPKSFFFAELLTKCETSPDFKPLEDH